MKVLLVVQPGLKLKKNSQRRINPVEEVVHEQLSIKIHKALLAKKTITMLILLV